MVISGRKHTVENTKGQQEITGFRIRKGGGAFIFPLLERVDILSLEVMTLDFTTPEVYTKPGVPIVVDGVAQVNILLRRRVLHPHGRRAVPRQRTWRR